MGRAAGGLFGEQHQGVSAFESGLSVQSCLLVLGGRSCSVFLLQYGAGHPRVPLGRFGQEKLLLTLLVCV